MARVLIEGQVAKAVYTLVQYCPWGSLVSEVSVDDIGDKIGRRIRQVKIPLERLQK